MRHVGCLLLVLVAVSGCQRVPLSGDPVVASEPSSIQRRGVTPSRPVTFPVRAALAANGTLYVTDAGAGAVFGYRHGQRVFQLLEVTRPLGIAVSEERLFVGDAGHRSVDVFSTVDGALLFALDGDIGMPNAIAVTPDGTRIYVADSPAHEVLIYSASGALIGGIDDSLRFPAAVAVDETRVVVADQGHHRVQVFDHDGTRLTRFGALPRGDDLLGAMVRPQSVAWVGDQIAVLDAALGTVQLFTANGTALGFAGGRGDCDACVDLALDLVWDARASTFVILDPNRRRWVRVPLDLRGQP